MRTMNGKYDLDFFEIRKCIIKMKSISDGNKELKEAISINKYHLERLSDKFSDLYERGIEEASLFEKEHPDKDIILLADGQFIIVDKNILLSDPENYDFGYSSQGIGVSAYSVITSGIGKRVQIKQDVEGTVFIKGLLEDEFDIPIAERLLWTKL